jgi:hypothetical protein
MLIALCFSRASQLLSLVQMKLLLLLAYLSAGVPIPEDRLYHFMGFSVLSGQVK